MESNDDFYDWEYDIYCGDETITCLSDDVFDELLNNFQKGMASQDLAKALNYAWRTVIDDLAKTKINWFELPVLLIIGSLYGIFFVVIFSTIKKENDAYRYFQENPEKLTTCSMNHISVESNYSNRHISLKKSKNWF